MPWWLIGALVWIALAVPAALLIGRAVRVADDRQSAQVEVGVEVEADHPQGPLDPAVTEPPVPAAEPQPWTGPATVPSPAPQQRRPWPVVRAPISRSERRPSPRDSGVI